MNRHPAFETISDMEDCVRNVARWGNVLRELGASASLIDPGSLWVIGHAVTHLGEEIQAKWGEAFRAHKRQP